MTSVEKYTSFLLMVLMKKIEKPRDGIVVLKSAFGFFSQIVFDARFFFSRFVF